MSASNLEQSEQPVLSVLQHFITTELLHDRPDVQIQPEDPLIQSDIIDSLGILEMVIFAEDHFDVTIEEEEIVLKNFSTLQVLSNFIHQKQNNSTP